MKIAPDQLDVRGQMPHEYKVMQFLILIRTWIIAIGLAAAAAFFSYQTFEVWSANAKPEAAKPVEKPPADRAARKVAYRRNPGYNAYAVIAQKNLFSSDRREKLPQKPQSPKPIMPVRPLDIRFALFGIVIDGDEKRALISNFNKKSATEKEYIWLKEGDKIGNLSVAEIQADRIIVTAGGNSYTVLLSDQDHPQKRSVTHKTIHRTGPGTKNIKKPEVISPSSKGTDKSS